jgi:hypothetical protein
MDEDNGDIAMAELEIKGSSQNKWLLTVVALCVLTAASWGVLGVKASAEKGIADAAAAKDEIAEVRMRLAVVESQRDEQRRAFDEMKTEFRSQLAELNRKMDWMIRRFPGGKVDGQ